MMFNTRRLLALTLAFLCLVGAACAATSKVTVQILASSDIHGRFLPYDYSRNEPIETGSMAQLASVVYQLRAEHISNTILVDNGDFAQGNFQHVFVNKPNPVILAMNEMGYDIVNLGNHEFNFGLPALQALMAQFHDPERVLCGNVFTPGGKRLYPLTTVITTDQGVAVGFIGTTSPNITRWDAAHLQDYAVTSPVEETRQAAKHLRDQVDILIAIAHMGQKDQYDMPHSGYAALAEACPELDLIIGGHTHEAIDDDYYYQGAFYRAHEATPEIRRKGILAVQPGRWAEALSRVLITLTRRNNRFVIADKATDLVATNLFMRTDERMIPPDPELMSLLLPFHDEAVRHATRKIGVLEGAPLVPDSPLPAYPLARLQPTALTELINAAQLEYGRLITGGRPLAVSAASVFAERANIQPGEIRYNDTALIYPFENTLYVLEMSGEQLRQYMEWCARYFLTFRPGDLTICFNPDFRGYNFDIFSGVHYEIDISRHPGERITKLTWPDGTPVDPRERFLVAVNNHRANAHLLTDDVVYDDPGNLPVLVARADDFSELGEGQIRDLIGLYIEKTKGGTITGEFEANWRIVGNDWDPGLREKTVAWIRERRIPVFEEATGDDPYPAAYAKPVTAGTLKELGLLRDPEPTPTPEPTPEPTSTPPPEPAQD